MYGDVDGDGNVTIADVTLIQQASIELVSFTNLQKQVADVNGDGKVNVLDASCVQRYIAGYSKKTGKTGEAIS